MNCFTIHNCLLFTIATLTFGWTPLLRRQSVDRRPDQRRKLHRRRLGEDHLRERTDQLGVGERAQVNMVINYTQDSV